MLLSVGMLLLVMIIPCAMLIFGAYYTKKNTDKINYLGYKTTQSMKSDDTWHFAHRYCGKLWLKLGKIVLAISAVVMLISLRSNMEMVSYIGEVLVVLQTVTLLVSMIPVERALRRQFDRHGNRREISKK